MYVHAIGFRDRLIGTVGDTLICFVNQTYIAKHIAIESENGCEAVRHSVVEPPHRSSEAVGLQGRFKFSDETAHKNHFSPQLPRVGCPNLLAAMNLKNAFVEHRVPSALTRGIGELDLRTKNARLLASCESHDCIHWIVPSSSRVLRFFPITRTSSPRRPAYLIAMPRSV